MTNNAPSTPRFQRLLKEAGRRGYPIILDGGTGTELDNRGTDTSGPLWSAKAAIYNPTLLESIHRDYIQGGAEIITTATFRTTRRAFSAAGEPPDLWRQSALAATSIARRTLGADVLLAGSVAPLEDCFSPHTAPGGPAASLEHELLCEQLVAGGVDVLWLETFGTLRELSAASDAARRAGAPYSIPFVVSVATNRKGSLISGESLEEALEMSSSKGASAFCINCIPPSHVETALSRLRAAGKPGLPIGIYPNCGFADANQDWAGSAYLTPLAFASTAKKWIQTDIGLIGGCCGTTPAHIRALKETLHPICRE